MQEGCTLYPNRSRLGFVCKYIQSILLNIEKTKYFYFHCGRH